MERVRRKDPRPLFRSAEFDEGLAQRAAAYIPFAQAVPHKPVIDAEHWLGLRTGACGACQAFCDAGAIDFDQQDTIQEIEVGSIVVATGFEVFDGRQIARYGYGRLKNVISSMDFERISHASGPTNGEILTSEGEPPAAVAIIHCVGSRDEHYHEYCSRVCCMYSLKFAHLVKEKTGAEVFNCYIDIFLNEEGDVANAYLQIPELRGFEKLCVGRPAEDMPNLTARICGVCPEAHHMAATKALDGVFHVDPPSPAKKLRELLYSIFFSTDHTTYFYALGGPDFIAM